MDVRRHFDDLAARALHTGRAQFTRFLEPSETPAAMSAAQSLGIHITFGGGWEDAERRIAAFYDGELDAPFPIESLMLHWNPKFASASHRDLLGAVMALGLERDALGDICLGVDPGCAYLFCIPEVADYIQGNLESAGRAKLKITRASHIVIAPPKGTFNRVTVQALRLDAIVAAGYRLSRSEAQRMISSGLVKRNHLVELRGDIHLAKGDLLSVRGYGRLRVDDIQGETRKGRLGVVLFRYGE